MMWKEEPCPRGACLYFVQAWSQITGNLNWDESSFSYLFLSLSLRMNPPLLVFASLSFYENFILKTIVKKNSESTSEVFHTMSKFCLLSELPQLSWSCWCFARPVPPSSFSESRASRPGSDYDAASPACASTSSSWAPRPCSLPTPQRSERLFGGHSCCRSAEGSLWFRFRHLLQFEELFLWSFLLQLLCILERLSVC